MKRVSVFLRTFGAQRNGIHPFFCPSTHFLPMSRKKRSGSKERPRWKKILWKTFSISIILFFGSSLFFTLLFRFVNPPVTPLMIQRCFDKRLDGTEPKINKTWVGIDKISPRMIQAAVAAEDNLFLQHNGFDWDGIREAIRLNRQGKKLYGGSTISQQTAKNVFLLPNRSWIRKGLEAYFTVLIETFWTKERIMEVYLNVCEMGKGIYGVEAAAQHYYGKTAARLTARESAMLAAILPSPLNRNPLNPSPYLRSRQQKMLVRMQQIGPVCL